MISDLGIRSIGRSGKEEDDPRSKRTGVGKTAGWGEGGERKIGRGGRQMK